MRGQDAMFTVPVPAYSKFLERLIDKIDAEDRKDLAAFRQYCVGQHSRLQREIRPEEVEASQ